MEAQLGEEGLVENKKTPVARGKWVITKFIEEALEKSEGGIYLPGSDKTIRAIVISVGGAVDPELEIKEGDELVVPHFNLYVMMSRL
jgi:co-chaperonin GroES (HSP10)